MKCYSHNKNTIIANFFHYGNVLAQVLSTEDKDYMLMDADVESHCYVLASIKNFVGCCHIQLIQVY